MNTNVIASMQLIQFNNYNNVFNEKLVFLNILIYTNKKWTISSHKYNQFNSINIYCNSNNVSNKKIRFFKYFNW